jgi:hypothetical protein
MVNLQSDDGTYKVSLEKLLALLEADEALRMRP